MTAKPLTPEEERAARLRGDECDPPCQDCIVDRRVWATLDAARAERDTLREQVSVLRESLGRCLQSAMKYGREGQVEMIQEALAATEEKP